VNKQFNNQFATQKLRQEASVTNFGGATFTPGTGEQAGPVAIKKVFKKKQNKEVKDVEPKYAAGKAKIYMKDKMDWKMAPSIPNRPSKGGFIYKQLFESLNPAIQKLIDYMIQNKIQKKVVKLKPDSNLDQFMADIKPAVDNKIIIAKLNPIDKTELSISLGPNAQKQFYIQELSEELSVFISENEPVDEVFSKADYEKAKLVLSKLKDTNSKLYNAIIALASDVYPHDFDKELGADIQAAGLNENYSKFKTETKTRNKPDQFHQAVRAVKKKVQEINRLFEYVSRLKSELSEGQDGLKYKMHTEKALAKIKEMVSELSQNVKKFK